jgi:hypothetical protein
VVSNGESRHLWRGRRGKRANAREYIAPGRMHGPWIAGRNRGKWRDINA